MRAGILRPNEEGKVFVTDGSVKTKTIKVNYLARIEGEGALYVRMRGQDVEDVQLKIFEPPRFFEAFLRGRSVLETPDITARICGICPVAYQMSAVYAVEQGLGVVVPPPIHDLRRLLYCGEWIESHALHLFMLHAPDFLGYPDAVAMAKDHAQRVEHGLAIKKSGNAIVALVGGREIHPINVKVGGFYSLPNRGELNLLKDQLSRALDLAIASTNWVAGFDFPDFDRSVVLVALRSPGEYSMSRGRIGSSNGFDFSANNFENFFEEIQVPHTNALHSVIKTEKGGGSYLTGPMARFALNRQWLNDQAKGLAQSLNLWTTVTNPFKSIVIRGIEIVHALEEAIKLIEVYEETSVACVDFELRAGEGSAATEAPRGLLYHRYKFDAEGIISDAKIVPPTSQNQGSIERDLRLLLPRFSKLPKAQMTHLCEQAIRNHDPCISCATHFLRLELESAEIDAAGEL